MLNFIFKIKNNFLRILCVCSVQLFTTLWTVAHQGPLSMEFLGQEYWSGLPFLPPGDLLNPGIKRASPASPALVGGFFTIVPLKVLSIF